MFAWKSAKSWARHVWKSVCRRCLTQSCPTKARTTLAAQSWATTRTRVPSIVIYSRGMFPTYLSTVPACIHTLRAKTQPGQWAHWLTGWLMPSRTNTCRIPARWCDQLLDAPHERVTGFVASRPYGRYKPDHVQHRRCRILWPQLSWPDSDKFRQPKGRCGGSGHVAPWHEASCISLPPGLYGALKRLRHGDRIAGFGHGGIQQHGIKTQFHCLCGLAGCANAGVDNQRHIGKPVAHGFQAFDIAQPLCRANRRAPGHQQLATRLQQLFAEHEVFGGIRKNLKSVCTQDTGGFQQRERIGLQGVGMANDLQLDPVGGKHFPRHMR